MVEQTTFQDILTCVIAVIIFIFQTLSDLITWINQCVKQRRDTAISPTSNTTTSCDSKTIDNNALGNFVRVQELIQKHFDIPLINAEEESKVDNLVQNSQISTSSNVYEEKNEFVNHLVDDSYAARGFGLIAATVGRPSEFYLYSKYGYNFENIVIELKGRNFEIGKATILNQNLVNPVKPKSIPIDYAYDDDRMKVTYIPFAEGVHTLTLMRNGVHICRSPYYISVEKSPTSSRSRIRLVTKKYKIVTKLGKGKCAPTEIKNSEMPVIESCKSSTELDVHSSAEDNYKGTDVMSIVTKFESKSASKELPKRLSSITERSPENDQADNDFIDSKEEPEMAYFPENNDTDDQNTKKKCKTDLKLENINLKNLNNLNTFCENITDCENSLSKKSDPIIDETVEITSNESQNESPNRQKYTQNKSLHNESRYKTEILDQTSQMSKPSQEEHDDHEIVVTTHQSKINVTDDKMHLINKIYKNKKIAIVKENIKELNKDSSIHVAQQIPDFTQYNISTPLAWIIKNITNSMCEKCSKQVFKILSELPRDINIKHDTNSKEICSSFETLLAQPIKININIDNKFENTSSATTDPYNSTHLKIHDSKNLEVDNTDVQNLNKIKSSHDNDKTLFKDTSYITDKELKIEQQKCDSEINEILEQNITDNISPTITECSIDLAGHQENELPLKTIPLQKLVNEKIEPINCDVLYSDDIRNKENKSEPHDPKLQTNSTHEIDLIKSNHCDEKLNKKYLHYDINKGRDLALETNDLLIVSCVKNINETQDSNKSILLKDAHIQQTNSKLHNCIKNNASSPSSSSLITNAELEDMECTKLEPEHQTFNVCEINNSYLNEILMIEQCIEPVLNSFKNKIIEKIVQLCVNENLSNTNFYQLLGNYKTNKNQKQHEIQRVDPTNKEKFLNAEIKAIENKKATINQENNYIDKNRIPDIISDKDKTNNDVLFEYIKNSFDKCKNSDEYNTETLAKKLYTVVNTKIHNLHDNHINEIYDINLDQKNEKDTFAQEIQFVTSTLNGTKVILEDESKSIKLETHNPGKILRDTETMPTKPSGILNDQNVFLQEVISNAETVTTDDPSFKRTETNTPISENNKTTDLNITNTNQVETECCTQTSNESESDVIKISTAIETKPKSKNQNIDDSITSTLELNTTLENKFSNFPMIAEATKLSLTKMETTYDNILNKIKADEVEKFNTVDTTEIIFEETTKTMILKDETIKDVNIIETKTIKVATPGSNESESMEKVEIPNVSEFKMSNETPLSEDIISVKHVECENNIELKTLSEINKIDCANLVTVDDETKFKLPSSNVTEIIVVNKTNSKEIAPRIDTSVSNSTAIVTIKIETQSDSYLPNTTLTIEVQKPNTVIIENLSNIKITKITKNCKENLKREIEIDCVEETPSINYSATLLSKTTNKNDLNNIKTTLKAINSTVTTEIQEPNETEVIEINRDKTNKIDALDENSVPVIESKKEKQTMSDIFVALTTPSAIVEELKEKNIYADTETSKLDNLIITFVEQSNKVGTITTPIIEKFNDIETIISEEKQILSETCIPNIFSNTLSKEGVIKNKSMISEENNTPSVYSDKLEDANNKLLPNMLSSDNRDTSIMLTPKSNKYEIEATSKTQTPNDISYDSIDTPIELQCESIVLDSSIDNIQSIFVDKNKLEIISETFVSNENPIVQLNKLNKEKLETTPITLVSSNTLTKTIETQNKLECKTVRDTLIPNNTCVKSEDKTEIKIISEAKVSNEILIKSCNKSDEDKIQETSELLTDMPVEDIDISKKLKTEPTLAILWPIDYPVKSNKEFLKNEERTPENLKLKNSVVEAIETPNESEIENSSKTLMSINKANELQSNCNEPQNGGTSETSISNYNQTICVEEKITPKTFIKNTNVATLLNKSNKTELKNILSTLKPNNMPTELTKKPNELGNITASVTPVSEDVHVNSDKESIKIEFEMQQKIQQERSTSNTSPTESIKGIKKLNVLEIENPLKISASSNTIAIMPKEKEIELSPKKLDHFKNDSSENQVSQNISEILVEESEKIKINTKIDSPISNDTFGEAKNVIKEEIVCTPKTSVLNNDTQTSLDENPNDIGLSIKSKTTLSKYTLSELKNEQKEENTILQTPVQEKTSSVSTEDFKTMGTEVKELASYLTSSDKGITDQNEFKITPGTLESKDTPIVLKRELENNKVELEFKLKTSSQNFTSTEIKEKTMYKDNTSDTLSYYDINSFQKKSEEKQIKAVILPQKSNITPTEIIETNNAVETLLPNHSKIEPEEEKIKIEMEKEILFSNYNINETLNEPNEIKTILENSGVSCILSELNKEQKNIESTTKSNETLVPYETSVSNDSPGVPEENLGKVLLNDCHAVTLQPNKLETAFMDDNSINSSFNNVKTSLVAELNKTEQKIITKSTSSNKVVINLAEEPKNSTLSKIRITNDSSVVLLDKQMEIETTTGNSIIHDDLDEPTEDYIKVSNKDNPFKPHILNDTLTEVTSTNDTFVTRTNEHIIVNLNTKFETPESTNDLTELNQNPNKVEISTHNVQLLDTLAMPINELEEKHINTTSENSFLNNLPTESFGETTDSKIDSMNIKLLTNEDPINEQNQREIDTTNQTQILNDFSDLLINDKNNDTKIDLISESSVSHAVSITELAKKPLLVKDANISETLVVNETQLKLEADQNKIENNITCKNILLNESLANSGENLKEIISEFNSIPNDTEKILPNEPKQINSDVLTEKYVQIVLTKEPNKQKTKANPESVLEGSNTIHVEEPSMVKRELTTDTLMLNDIQAVSIELNETKIKTTPVTLKLDNTLMTLREPKEYRSETPPSNFNTRILLEESNDIKIDTISNKLVSDYLKTVTESTAPLTNDAALLVDEINLERIKLNVSEENDEVESPLTKEIDALLIVQKPNDTTMELVDKKSETDQVLFYVPVTDQISKMKTIGEGSECDFIITKSTKIKKGETQKLPEMSMENISKTIIETTSTENISLVDEETEQISNTTKTPQTEEILEPLPEVENFNFSETTGLANPITVNIETISDTIDKLNYVKSDHENDHSPAKRKNIAADESKYMKPDNTYDSLISKTIKATSVKKSNESDEHKISKLEKKKITVGAEIEIIDSKQNTESECEHQSTIFETSNDIKSVNIINTCIAENLQNTFEANKSSYTETESYGKLNHPTTIVLKKNVTRDDNENINVQKNCASENRRTEKSNTSDSLKNYDETSQKSLSEVKNDSNVNMYGIQKLEMSMECTKTSNEDYFEKTFVKLEQTEKISIDKNECDDNTTLPEEKSYIVNESDLNAILCASSLEEALTLLDSKIKFKFKNKTRRSSSIINSTMYKQSLQTSTSDNSEKNTNFAEAQEFFKNFEKNNKN